MEELVKQLDKSSIRIETKNKIPQVLDWVSYKEVRNIKRLLEENREYGLRTGIKIGNYWFCALDIDQKGWTKMFKSWQSYIKTRQGIHVYLKIKGQEPPKNSMLFFEDKRIGDLLSKGRQIVGVGSFHQSGIIYQLVKNGKWFMRLESIEELRKKLAKYGIELR